MPQAVIPQLRITGAGAACAFYVGQLGFAQPP